MNTFINRDKMWFGTADYMQWIDTPETGADVSSVSFSADSALLNGGGYARTSWDSHKTYQFSWGDSASLALSHAINAYRNGTWGRGLIYFHDPMTYETNILPKRWADPSMAANYEAEPIIPDVFPTTSPASPGPLGLPVRTATYRVPAGYSSQTNASEHYIPVPPGMVLMLGAVYSGVAKLYVRIDGGSPIDLVTLSAGDISSGTTVNTWVGGTNVYLGVRNTTGAAANIILSAITARLTDYASAPIQPVVPGLSTGTAPGFIPAMGPWMSGEGHSGVRFVGTPTTVNYNGVDGGQMGVSCTLKEVGAWA